METLVFSFLLATHLGMLRDIRHSSSLSLPVFILLTLPKNHKLCMKGFSGQYYIYDMAHQIYDMKSEII
jgi:hypothetical protein